MKHPNLERRRMLSQFLQIRQNTNLKALTYPPHIGFNVVSEEKRNFWSWEIITAGSTKASVTDQRGQWKSPNQYHISVFCLALIHRHLRHSDPPISRQSGKRYPRQYMLQTSWDVWIEGRSWQPANIGCIYSPCVRWPCTMFSFQTFTNPWSDRRGASLCVDSCQG